MQKRIIVTVIISILPILLTVGIISYLNVHSSIQQSIGHHLVMANIMSRHIDYILESNLKRLYDISLSGRINFRDSDWKPEKNALKIAYEYSIFTDRIFLLDRLGNVVLTYPHQEDAGINLLSIPDVSRIISERKPSISNVFTLSPSQKKVIFALVPLTDETGDVIGVAGGQVDPTNYLFLQILKSIPSLGHTLVELVDKNGIIITSTDPKRILTSESHNEFLGSLIAQKKDSVARCHRCHVSQDFDAARSQDMLAFAPLSAAPWGILIREPESIVFGPSTSLKKGFIALSVIAIITALLLGVGLSRGIVRPVRHLIEATNKIGSGNLSEPISVHSRDEIRTLAESFDIMRQKLRDSLEEIRQHSLELEEKVNERTLELNKRKRQLSLLLREGMNAEEEERRRIARELHDETSQTLAALGMSLDLAAMNPKGKGLTPEMFREMKERVSTLVDGIHRIIQDLRPPVLDDLGIESAINWLIQKYITPYGISSSVTTEGLHGLSLEKKAELTLFRVIQEALTNIARHAQADSVCVTLVNNGKVLEMVITDSGSGFNAQDAFDAQRKEDSLHGFGLLGMRERIEQLGGILSIYSYPHEGTVLSASIPLDKIAVRSPLEAHA